MTRISAFPEQEVLVVRDERAEPFLRVIRSCVLNARIVLVVRREALVLLLWSPGRLIVFGSSVDLTLVVRTGSPDLRHHLSLIGWACCSHSSQ